MDFTLVKLPSQGKDVDTYQGVAKGDGFILYANITVSQTITTRELMEVYSILQFSKFVRSSIQTFETFFISSKKNLPTRDLCVWLMREWIAINELSSRKIADALQKCGIGYDGKYVKSNWASGIENTALGSFLTSPINVWRILCLDLSRSDSPTVCSTLSKILNTDVHYFDMSGAWTWAKNGIVVRSIKIGLPLTSVGKKTKFEKGINFMRLTSADTVTLEQQKSVIDMTHADIATLAQRTSINPANIEQKYLEQSGFILYRDFEHLNCGSFKILYSDNGEEFTVVYQEDRSPILSYSWSRGCAQSGEL